MGLIWTRNRTSSPRTATWHTSGNYRVQQLGVGKAYQLTHVDYIVDEYRTLTLAKAAAEEHHAARERFNAAIMSSSPKLWREGE